MRVNPVESDNVVLLSSSFDASESVSCLGERLDLPAVVIVVLDQLIDGTANRNLRSFVTDA